MKSRKGELVCVGCGPVGKKEKPVPEEKKVEEPKVIREYPILFNLV